MITFEIFLYVLEQEALAPESTDSSNHNRLVQLAEDVTPFAIEETLPSIFIKQSATLIIKGVLGDLVAEVETAIVHEVKEEEGSSSTSVKDDNGGGDGDDEDRTEPSSEEHTEQQVMIQTEGQALIVVEESVSERDKEEITSKVAEDEVQVMAPPTRIQYCSYDIRLL